MACQGQIFQLNEPMRSYEENKVFRITSKTLDPISCFFLYPMIAKYDEISDETRRNLEIFWTIQICTSCFLEISVSELT
jgi:hypothetical protein